MPEGPPPCSILALSAIATAGPLANVAGEAPISYMDLGDLGRGLHSGWPQGDIGIVLWSLSVAANTWQTREHLTRLCTIPNRGVLNATWDTGSMAMEANILRPLLWFGLLEHKQEKIEGDKLNRRKFYRKSPLFDRFCHFNVSFDNADSRRH